MRLIRYFFALLLAATLWGCGGGGSGGGSSGATSSSATPVPSGTVSVLASISAGQVQDVTQDSSGVLYVSVDPSSSTSNSMICQFSLASASLQCPNGSGPLSFEANRLVWSGSNLFTTSSDVSAQLYAVSTQLNDENSSGNIILPANSSYSFLDLAAYGSSFFALTGQTDSSGNPYVFYCDSGSCQRFTIPNNLGNAFAPSNLTVIPRGCTPSELDLVIVGSNNSVNTTPPSTNKTLEQYCVSSSDPTDWTNQSAPISLNASNSQIISAMTGLMVNGTPQVYVSLVDQVAHVGSILQVNVSSPTTVSVFSDATHGLWQSMTSQGYSAGLCNATGLTNDGQYLYVANGSPCATSGAGSSANTLLKIKLPNT